MTDKKSLQKFTDLETIEDVEQFIIENPKLKKEVYKSLLQRINDSYLNKTDNEYKLTEMLLSVIDDEDEKHEIKNITYETNHTLITNFMHNYLLENRYFPTVPSIQSGTNLSRQTIYKHFKDGLLSDCRKITKGKNTIMKEQALEKLYLIGVEDNNPTALKHFIQLSGAVSLNNTPQINNFIQINNLKISSEDINKLPIDDILEIEKIVSRTLLH